MTPNLPNLVDKLGGLNAQITTLQAQADAIKDELKASGLPENLGERYRASISTASSKLDPALVRPLLSPELVRACTKTTTSTRLTLYGL